MLPNTLLTADAQAELALFTDALERFCDAEIEPHYRAWEKAGIVPRELFLKMGDNGYLCADVPEQYGGSGASVLRAAVCNETVVKAPAKTPKPIQPAIFNF